MVVVALISVAFSRGSIQSRPLSFKWKAIHNVRKGLWDISAKYPCFVGNSSFVRATNRLVASAAIRSTTDFLKDAKSSTAAEKPTSEYYHEDNFHVSVALPGLVSLVDDVSEYTGGAHPNRNLIAWNFSIDAKAGSKRIAFKDAFARGDRARPKISKLVVSVLRGYGADWVQDGTLKELDKNEADNFVLTPSGFTFLFAPYVAGSYAQGSFEVKIPFSKVTGELDPAGPLRPLLQRAKRTQLRR